MQEYNKGGNLQATYAYGANDQRLSYDDGSTNWTYMNDGRGSVSNITGQQGKNLVNYTYHMFGEVLSQTGTTTSNYNYNGEYTDQNTGMQYLRARYYDTTIGRFTSADSYMGSLSNPLTQNRYTYAGNDPYNMVDPSGHTTTPLGNPFDRAGNMNNTIDAQLKMGFITPTQATAKKELAAKLTTTPVATTLTAAIAKADLKNMATTSSTSSTSSIDMSSVNKLFTSTNGITLTQVDNAMTNLQNQLNGKNVSSSDKAKLQQAINMLQAIKNKCTSPSTIQSQSDSTQPQIQQALANLNQIFDETDRSWNNQLNYAVNYLVSGIGGAVGQDLSSMVSSAQNIYNFVQNLNKYNRASYANMMMSGSLIKDTSSEEYKQLYDYYYNQGYNLYTGLAGLAFPELDSLETLNTGNTNQELFSELENQGIKFNEGETQWITKTKNGNITWLESGDENSGLQHIVSEHADDFLKWGLSSNQEEISTFIKNSVNSGNYTVEGPGDYIYNVMVNGESKQMEVVTGSNGYIVTAHPYSK